MKKLLISVIVVFFINNFCAYSQNKVEYKIDIKGVSAKFSCVRQSKDTINLTVTIRNNTSKAIYYIRDGIYISSIYNKEGRAIVGSSNYYESSYYKLKRLGAFRSRKINRTINSTKDANVYLSGEMIFFTKEDLLQKDSILGMDVELNCYRLVFDSLCINNYCK